MSAETLSRPLTEYGKIVAMGSFEYDELMFNYFVIGFGEFGFDTIIESQSKRRVDSRAKVGDKLQLGSHDGEAFWNIVEWSKENMNR